jgi:hypothetical protein
MPAGVREAIPRLRCVQFAGGGDLDGYHRKCVLLHARALLLQRRRIAVVKIKSTRIVIPKRPSAGTTAAEITTLSMYALSTFPGKWAIVTRSKTLGVGDERKGAAVATVVKGPPRGP